ncbi:MAG: hypothetical protein JST22_10210 [Bacteroidetes bacterium]|nr:hypothetical protein [Bacteroidota bacterium]
MPIILIPIIRLLTQPHASRADAQAWKEYTCVACGGVFRTLIEAKRARRGATLEEAEEQAGIAVINAIAMTVPIRACPNCGCYQQDMAAVDRERKLWPAAVAPLAGMALAMAAMPAQANPMLWGAGIAVILGGIALLALLAQYNLNRDPEAARMKAESLVQQNLLEQTSPGDDPVIVAHGMPRFELDGRLKPVLVMIAGVLLFAAADAALWLSGAPLNLDCRPVVAGPGDNVRINFATPVSTAKGYWNAHAVVHISNAAELGITDTDLVTETNHDSWGNALVGEHVTNSNADLWAGLVVPNLPSLVGRTLKIDAQLEVTYPEVDDDARTFHEVNRLVTYNTSVVMAGSGAGSRQAAFSWMSMIVGGGMIVAGIAMLLQRVRGMRSAAPQPQIHPVVPMAAADNDLL